MSDDEGATGITLLQLLQADVAVLKKVLEGVEAAETTSVAAARVAAHIAAAESKDHFLEAAKPGGM